MRNIFKKKINILIVAAIFTGILLFAYLRMQERNISAFDVHNGKNDKLSSFEAMKAELPAVADKNGIIKKIFDAAKGSNLKIREGNYKEELVKGGRVSKISYSCSLSGNYSQLKKFIYDLEKLEGVITVEELTLEKKKEDVELTVLISIFLR